MNDDTAVAIFVPIIFFLVIGAIIIAYFYFRSREKQIMLNKGFNAEQIVEIYKSRKNSIVWIKLGVLSVFVAIGFAISAIIGGSMGYKMEHILDHVWTAIFVIMFSGLGFVAAYFIAKKVEPNGNGLEKK